MNKNLSDADAEQSWLAFIGRLHVREGGSKAALASLQAHCLSLLQAIRQGDSCIALTTDLPESPLVSRLPSLDAGEQPTLPARMLVFEADHLYLQRLWLAETRVSRALLALNREDRVADPAKLAACLAEHERRSDPSSAQVQAIRVGLRRRLLLLTGGPGTGKTFTLARLIAAISEVAPDLRIALAAPTGKAAARLSQALAGAMISNRWSVRTVHSLVGMRAPGVAPRHGRENPLPYDVVVIDEASMLGLELASSLLQALPSHARLILAGDGDQLASVDPGSVFADVLAAGATGLSGALVRLRQNYRQQNAPGLARLARGLQEGLVIDEETSEVRLIETTGDGQQRLIEQAADRYRSLLQCSTDQQHPSTSESLLAVASQQLADLEGYRLLSALRTGPWGSAYLADAIDKLMRRHCGAVAQALWYEGRLVMLTRNLRAAGRVNGDVGLCCRRGEHLGVLFDDPAGEQWLPVSQLQYVEPAWCLTVHKAQGSEYDEVDLVIAPPSHALARREVVYTGVTRARLRVRIWGSRPALQEAAENPLERRGTLLARLGIA